MGILNMLFGNKKQGQKIYDPEVVKLVNKASHIA